MSRKLFTLGFLLTFALLPALAQRITGSISGAASGMTRVGATTGSFSPGIQRAFQFGIRVSF